MGLGKLIASMGYNYDSIVKCVCVNVHIPVQCMYVCTWCVVCVCVCVCVRVCVHVVGTFIFTFQQTGWGVMSQSAWVGIVLSLTFLLRFMQHQPQLKQN